MTGDPRPSDISPIRYAAGPKMTWEGYCEVTRDQTRYRQTYPDGRMTPWYEFTSSSLWQLVQTGNWAVQLDARLLVGEGL